MTRRRPSGGRDADGGRKAALERFARTALPCGYDGLAPASSDASFRRYFRVRALGKSFIIMDAPPEHEDCRPFIDIAGRLARAGLAAPTIHAVDLDSGFLLLEDLGPLVYLDVLTPDNATTLYGAAVDALVTMQTHVDATDLPDFVDTCFDRELALFTDWLLARHLGIDAAAHAGAIDATAELMREALLAQPRVFVHRDYHSRNLTWPAGDAGTPARPGLLDFQDAVCGPLAYDLVSVLRDCYIEWPPALVDALVKTYLARLGAAAPAFEVPAPEDFRRAFDLTGVQRHLKAAGIFARLAHRDGKARYLDDLPLTLGYVARVARTYPELRPLAGLVEGRVLPALDAARGRAG